MQPPARYDEIGADYGVTRREDPRIAGRIHEALGGARTVVNVGAGTGSYEPRDRYVIAIEPSDVMAEQRGADRVPAIRASAGSLPLRDRSVDAAMVVLSLHHWEDEQEAGVRELRRVARGPIVIATVDTDVSGQMWLPRDYLPEVAALDRATFPQIERIVDWLGRDASVEIVPISRDTPDWSLLSFWAHPLRLLDARARHATSGIARMDRAVVDRAIAHLDADLRSGEWHRRNGHLDGLDEFDAGLRLIVATATPS